MPRAAAMRSPGLVRQLGSILLLPFVVIVVVPSGILLEAARRGGGPVWLTLAGAGLALVGLVLMVETITLFVRIGRGTLAPWDPTRKLVAVGPYRYVRNPMISGVLFVLLGEVALFASPALLVWFLLFGAGNALYLPWVEEPGLVRRFGEAYETYRRNVPRWIPRLTPWESEAGGAAGGAAREEIRRELEDSRATFHRILDSLTEEEWGRTSRNPAWTNGDVLVHMMFGYALLFRLVPFIRWFSRLPKGLLKGLAWFLDRLKRPFDRLNARWPARTAGRSSPRGLGERYDRMHARLLGLLDSVGEADLRRGIFYPTKLSGALEWNPSFREFLTIEDAFRYMTRHFHHHRSQLTCRQPSKA